MTKSHSDDTNEKQLSINEKSETKDKGTEDLTQWTHSKLDTIVGALAEEARKRLLKEKVVCLKEYREVMGKRKRTQEDVQL